MKNVIYFSNFIYEKRDEMSIIIYEKRDELFDFGTKCNNIMVGDYFEKIFKIKQLYQGKKF